MSTATLAPFAKAQFFTDAGLVAAAYKLYTYAAGTTTDATTYTNANMSAANTNPIILDAAGRAVIFLNPANEYKFVLKTAADVTVWTLDGIAGVPLEGGAVEVSGIAGESLGNAGNCCYMSDGEGGLTAGRWYLADKDLTYKSFDAQLIGFVQQTGIVAGNQVTFRVSGEITGLSGLTTGTNYSIGDSGALATAASLVGVPQRFVGRANSTTSIVASPWTVSPLEKSYQELTFTIGIKGAAALSTGVHLYREVPFGFYVTGWTLVADQTGSLVIDVWAEDYANSPPAVGDTIAGSEKPTLTAAQKNQDLTLTTWTPYIAPGDVIGINVDSAATCTWATLTLRGYVVV